MADFSTGFFGLEEDFLSFLVFFSGTAEGGEETAVLLTAPITDTVDGCKDEVLKQYNSIAR